MTLIASALTLVTLLAAAQAGQVAASTAIYQASIRAVGGAKAGGAIVLVPYAGDSVGTRRMGRALGLPVWSVAKGQPCAAARPMCGRAVGRDTVALRVVVERATRDSATTTVEVWASFRDSRTGDVLSSFERWRVRLVRRSRDWEVAERIPLFAS